MRRKLSNHLPTWAVFVVLTGCASQTHELREVDLGFSLPKQFEGSSAIESPMDLGQWWRRFNDANLDYWVETALVANPDVGKAKARLMQARAAERQSFSRLQPQVSIASGAQRNDLRYGASTERYSAYIDVGWTADLFGEIRHTNDAATADSDATYFRLEDIRNAVAAEVARTVIQGRLSNLRKSIAEGAVNIQQLNLRNARWREQAGLASHIDVVTAEEFAAQTAASIPTLEREYASAMNRLSVLTGSFNVESTETQRMTMDLPILSDEFALEAPAVLLRRRPDIRAAEQDLIAASARADASKAQMFPSLEFNSNLGSSAPSIRDISELLSLDIGLSITQWLFDGGKRHALVGQRDALVSEAQDAYRSIVLGSFEDVNNAIAARHASAKRIAALEMQTAASKSMALWTRLQYGIGLVGITQLNEAEQTLLTAQDNLAAANAERVTADIQLFVAMGGGWETREPLALMKGAIR